MDYDCKKSPKNIKAKSNYKHFKSKSHIEFDKCKQIILSPKDIDIKNRDKAFYLYIIEHNKKFDFYLVKCEFELVFKDSQYCPYITSKFSDNETMISESNFLEKISSDFKDKGYTFNQVAEMHSITIANKLDMTYDFFFKHNMCALE